MSTKRWDTGHLGMTIGLKEFRDPAELSLPRLLVQPFYPLRKENDEGHPDKD